MRDLLVYQYPDSDNAVKKLALKSLEPTISPTRQSQEQFEERLLQQGLEGLAMGDNDNNNIKTDATFTTFEFPIGDIRGEAPMKNIPLSSLPSFQGMIVEDPDTFLFEFDVLCRSYDYVSDAHKLKLFPATLKGEALRWFMGLGSPYIRTWSDMKETFLSKYQDYCRIRDLREEVFRMTWKEDESMEDYVEWFHYNF